MPRRYLFGAAVAAVTRKAVLQPHDVLHHEEIRRAARASKTVALCFSNVHAGFATSNVSWIGDDIRYSGFTDSWPTNASVFREERSVAHLTGSTDLCTAHAGHFTPHVTTARRSLESHQVSLLTSSTSAA